ncbi:DUF488 domain-containing protein [Lacticaseibacillus thailandensis]|nr:DUF488 family protein [Lacticaseibacillus thailandensis]
MTIKLERIYTRPGTPGFRILTDRLWPRGIKKVDAHLDLWAKDIAPTNDLRKWFNHEPAKFAEFTTRYMAELDTNPATDGFINTLNEQLATGTPVILLFGAKDTANNQAVVLNEWLVAHGVHA